MTKPFMLMKQFLWWKKKCTHYNNNMENNNNNMGNWTTLNTRGAMHHGKMDDHGILKPDFYE